MPCHGCNTIKSLSPVTITSAFAANTSQHGIIVRITTNLLGEFARGNTLGETLILIDQLLDSKAGAGDMMCVFWAMQDFTDFID